MMLDDLGKTVTYRVELPGGQKRLKEAAIYVMELAKDFEYFGLVKLNKVLWRADFLAFHERQFPITGRQYQKLEHGPAPVEMRPVLREMEETGWMTYITSTVPHEKRPAPLSPPKLMNLSPRELEFLKELAEHYRNMTAAQTSKNSHGVAWNTRDIGSLIPYEAVIFDDTPLPQELEHKLLWLGRERNWRSA